MKTPAASQLRARPLDRGRRQSRGDSERDRRRAGCDDRLRRARFRRDAETCPRSRRAGAAQAHLPRARPDDQSARPRDHGPQGRAVRAQLLDRRDAQGRLDRHRGRRGHALLLLVQGPPRAPRRARAARRPTRRAVEEGHVRRPAHLHVAPRARRCTSTPSISPCGACSKSSPRRSSPGFRQS